MKHQNKNYELALQLYYLNKPENKKEARLPLNDFRRPLPKKQPSVIPNFIEKALFAISLKRTFTEIAVAH